MFEQSRLAAVSTELKDRNSSSGLRMGFYQNSIQIIKKNPLFGVGTGGFPAAYQAQVAADPGLKVTPNPHNQYLLMWAEIGLVGLILFLYFLGSAWRLSMRLPFDDRCMIQGLVLLFSMGSLFNSLLLDAGEGRFYCTLLALLVSSFACQRTRIK
jgi:O-antigen ligase